MFKPFVRLFAGFGLALLLLSGGAQAAGDPPDCKKVHFSDVGWSCITATTAIASQILEALGYEPKATILSVPVTFESLKAGDLDAFLGLWLPTQESMIRPYLDEGSIEQVTTNLTGASYTLAVPKYVHDAGVKDFADLAQFKDNFGGKFYGIEPGNDGNMLIQQMIDDNTFGLADWEIVESSEQGMLSQVDRAVRTNEWIVFLGWAPHPMNANFDMAYLGGGDDVFGPNFGGAEVYTLAHQGYTQQCPNVGQLLTNVTFTVKMVSTIMGWMLDEGMEPDVAAVKMLRENPDVLAEWLEGVTTIDGGDAGAAVNAHLGM
ncbi:MAG: choline ABC transporter substrate-binding protein [Proteobacteria bacterium]|nr:choline ABC transporter substrate-binding protein [Pseudomonadota bacterium]